MKVAGTRPLILLIAIGISGCSLMPSQAVLQRVHDFGPLPTAAPDPPAHIRVESVAAPTWLSTDAIHYRLVYDDPTQLRSYADHRWAAPPAEMLGARLQRLLPQSAVTDKDHTAVYVLDVTILEFEQDFPAANSADVRVELQASLRSAVDGHVVAQRSFGDSHSVPPDVHGAIAGMADLATKSADSIAVWAFSNSGDQR